MVAFDSALFRTLATLALLIAIVSALFLAQAVFIPLFMATFFALLLNLPMSALQRIGVPRFVSAIGLSVALFGLLAVLYYFIREPINQVVRDYPSMVAELRFKMANFRQSLSEAQELGDAISEMTENMSDSPGAEDGGADKVVVQEDSVVTRTVVSIASFGTSAVVTLTICMFILSIRRPFLTIFTLPFATTSGKLHAARVWKCVERNISTYLLVTTIINITLGIIVGFSLSLLGVSNPVLWGTVVALLNYMPFIGPTIGSALLLAASVIQFDTLSAMVLPAAVYLLINFIEANFVTPNLLGRRVNIAPLAIILALLFWGWLWGFPGLFLSVPILVILKAMAEQSAYLAPVRRMLTPRVSHPNLFAMNRPVFGTKSKNPRC